MAGLARCARAPSGRAFGAGPDDGRREEASSGERGLESDLERMQRRGADADRERCRIETRKKTTERASKKRERGTWSDMKTRVRQQEFGFTNWGGKRRGAGRKPKGERAGVSHAARPKLAARYPVLVTLRLRAGLPSLRAQEEHERVRSALAASTKEDFRVVEYSAQSNHVHLLVEAADADALARGMTGLAVRVVRGLQRLWRRVGAVLSDRYHARILRTPSEVRTALVYVLQLSLIHIS